MPVRLPNSNVACLEVWCALVNATVTWRPLDERLFHNLDWNSYLTAAIHHGVLAIAADRLFSSSFASSLDRPVVAQLRRALHANLLRATSLADEVLRVADEFSARGIPIIPYKGPVLAEHLWGNFALRKCDDVDFLVARKDADDAGKIMTRLGYQSVTAVPPHLLPAFLRNASEEQFRHRETNLLLELQWSPAPRVFAVDCDPDEIWKRTQTISFSGRNVLSLSPEDLFIFLSIHGWKHNWEKLIWIGDIAQLLQKQELDWDYLFAYARRHRITRVLALSLRLVIQLFGIDIPRQFAFPDPPLDDLAAELLSHLGTSKPFSYRDWHWLMLLARDNRWDRLRQVFTFLFTPGLGEYKAVSLPPWATPLYRAVRLARLLKLSPHKK